MIFTSLIKGKVGQVLSLIADLASIIGVLWWLLGFFGLVETEIVFRTNAGAVPKVSVFQGSTIRIDVDLRNNVLSSEIRNPKWTFISNGSKSLEINELQKDVILAPSFSGLVKLAFEGETGQGKKISGVTNLLVAQKKPAEIKIDKNGMKIEEGSARYFNEGDRVYFLTGATKIPGSVSKVAGSLYIKPDERLSIPTYDRKVYLDKVMATKNDSQNEHTSWPVIMDIDTGRMQTTAEEH